MKQKYVYNLLIFFILLSCSNHNLKQKQKPDALAKSILEEMINDSDTPEVQYIILNSNKILFEYYDGLAKLDIDDFDYDKFVREVLQENNELDNPPGEEFSYSNIGCLSLGEIIIKTSGENYTKYIKNHIYNLSQILSI